MVTHTLPTNRRTHIEHSTTTTPTQIAGRGYRGCGRGRGGRLYGHNYNNRGGRGRRGRGFSGRHSLFFNRYTPAGFTFEPTKFFVKLISLMLFSEPSWVIQVLEKNHSSTYGR